MNTRVKASCYFMMVFGDFKPVTLDLEIVC